MLFRHPGVRCTPRCSPCAPAPAPARSGARAAVLALSSMISAARKSSKCASTRALLPLILLQVTHRVLLQLPLWRFLFKSISSMLSLKHLLLITSHSLRMPSAVVRFALLCTDLQALDTFFSFATPSLPTPQLCFYPRCNPIPLAVTNTWETPSWYLSFQPL